MLLERLPVEVGELAVARNAAPSHDEHFVLLRSWPDGPLAYPV